MFEYFSSEAREQRAEVRAQRSHDHFVERTKKNLIKYRRTGNFRGMLVKSAEGVRHFGSARPLPTMSEVEVEPVQEEQSVQLPVVGVDDQILDDQYKVMQPLDGENH